MPSEAKLFVQQLKQFFFRPSRRIVTALIIGGIFVAEALSVLIQVVSYRFFHRKVFRMTPLHHHFELGGLPESKVTIRFWIVAVVLGLVAMTSLKVR